MQNKISALLALQSIEQQIAQVRRRLNARRRAVTAQQKRIEQLQADFDTTHQQALSKQADADRQELDLKQRQEQVTHNRALLNTAKTNKEYATLLTQINTMRADNSKHQEDILLVMQEAEAVKAQAEEIKQRVAAETDRLEDIQRVSGEEIDRLEKMLDELLARRDTAAAGVPEDILAVFDRLSESYEGEAMALIEVHGRKKPFDYVCGGCFMTISAEHANALQTRGEIRTCNNCGRILYLKEQADAAQKAS